MNGIHDVAEKYKICGTHGAVNGSKRDLNWTYQHQYMYKHRRVFCRSSTTLSNDYSQFQFLYVLMRRAGSGMRERRSPADWKHLGDCREHYHVTPALAEIRRCPLKWQLWPRRACVCALQLPASALAGKEDRARRSGRWMVPPLLTGKSVDSQRFIRG